VKLAVDPRQQGAELLALVTGSGDKREQDLTTDTSFGASYVRERYLSSLPTGTRQAALDRLGPAETRSLVEATAAARAAGGPPKQAPTYLPADQVSDTETLRAASAPLNQALEAIKAILLVGLANGGEGLLATSVTFGMPVGVVGDGKGNLFVAELTAARVRRIGADGRVTLYAGLGKGPNERESDNAHDAPLGVIVDMQPAADGSLLIVESTRGQVRRLTPDGKLRVVAGTGKQGAGADAGPAGATQLAEPTCVAAGPDGSVYVGDGFADNPRLLKVDAAGQLARVPLPAPTWDGTPLSGLAVTADGGLYAVTQGGSVLHRDAAGSWRQLLKGLNNSIYSRVVVDPAGGCFVTETRGCRVIHLSLDGKAEIIAGQGRMGNEGDGGPASAAFLGQARGLWLAPDRKLVVADTTNGLVREIDLAKTPAPIRTVAGTRGVAQVGDAGSLAVNQPTAVSYDRTGRLVFAEGSSHTVKRLDGGVVELLAGTTAGFAGDGGPAVEARLSGPSGITFAGDDLYILDTANNRLRRVDASGRIDSVAGTFNRKAAYSSQPFDQPALPAAQAIMGRAVAVAIGPDGQPWWTDNALNLVLRLDKGGDVVVVAGSIPAIYDKSGGDAGDGGLATQAQLNRPLGLAFDSKGTCYVADSFNMRVRAIDPATGTIRTVAGKSLFETLPALSEASPQGVLVVPGSLVVDRDDRLYIAELGTMRTELFGLVGGGLPDLPRVAARISRLDLRDPAARPVVVAGPGSAIMADPFADGALRLPVGLALAPDGGLAIADGGDDQIKLLPARALQVK
jgi:sugar lactone lactonase YvrE